MKPSLRKLQLEEYNYLREYDNHAEVYEFSHEATKLRGYIAIHAKRGRLSTGGTRFFNYATESDALKDVLRLSAAMTSKCVVAGLPYGGAKSVIIGDPLQIKNEALLIAYAEIVTMLEGQFYTGEDVGMTEEDVQVLINHSPFFNGKTGGAGDPSPHAAQSVLVVMKKAVQLFSKNNSLSGSTVAVKGLGKVGGALAGYLINEGAQVLGADIDSYAVKQLSEKYPAMKVHASDKIAFMECNIFAPCAFGREVRMDNFDQFKAKIICGGANNQLEQISLATQLMKREILYVPDYLANAGGLINVSEELELDGFNAERIEARINNLAVLLEQSYTDAQSRKISLAESVSDFVLSQLAV